MTSFQLLGFQTTKLLVNFLAEDTSWSKTNSIARKKSKSYRTPVTNAKKYDRQQLMGNYNAWWDGWYLLVSTMFIFLAFPTMATRASW